MALAPSPAHLYASGYLRALGVAVDDSRDEPGAMPCVDVWVGGGSLRLEWAAGAMRYQLRGERSAALSRAARRVARALSEPGTLESWRRWYDLRF